MNEGKMIEGLLNEYKEKKEIENRLINNLGIQSKVIDLIEEKKEYDTDLSQRNFNEAIEEELISNIERLGDMYEIIDYISNNENKVATNMVYGNLNSEVINVINFIRQNARYFNEGGVYANFYANFMSILNTTKIILLGEFRNNYNTKLLEIGKTIGKESFYLKLKNDLFNIVNNANNNLGKTPNLLISSIDKNPLVDKKTEYISTSNGEIEMNNYVLGLMTDLVDFISINKNEIIGNLTLGNFNLDFEDIKEFFYVNEENLNLLTNESIYFDHFRKFLVLIEKGGEETIEKIEKELLVDLNINMDEYVSINEGYYDEMKEELVGTIKSLNNIITINKLN